ncbi:MAG: hypothetical protein P8177_07700, partial [Gemmatimonadota bacterium]
APVALRTCFVCHQKLPANRTVERFPIGRRIAFDPWNGRLWAVCSSGGRCTLAPFDSRWEALEELERLARDRARLLAETDAIGLLSVGDVELVRVGTSSLREESWWRYGREYSARRRRAGRIALRGKVFDAVLFMLIAGVPFWGFSEPGTWIARARRKRFGRIAWTGAAVCTACGYVLDRLPFREYGDLRLQTDAEGRPALAFGCPRCLREAIVITGVPAMHTLRRGLAFTNFDGGAESDVQAAMDLVDRYPAPPDLVRDMAGRRIGLGAMGATGALALEIALGADDERRLLQLEVRELEARWREEEAIAAIADALL